MKRALGLLCAWIVAGCVDASGQNKPTRSTQHDAGSVQADSGASDAMVGNPASCVDHSEDRVSDPGFSCSTGTICTHFIGAAWTEATVRYSCTETAKYQGGVACVNSGYCKRSSAKACRVRIAAGKFVFVFGGPEAECLRVGGTLVPEPAAGWPAKYTALEVWTAPDAGDLADAGADAGTSASEPSDAATADAALGDAGK